MYLASAVSEVRARLADLGIRAEVTGRPKHLWSIYEKMVVKGRQFDDIFDLERGTIRHTNAGHLYPYLLRNDMSAPISIECPSLPLGVREQMVTRTVEVPLREGDSIVYLSDGIVEAQDANGDPLFPFGQATRMLSTADARRRARRTSASARPRIV